MALIGKGEQQVPANTPWTSNGTANGRVTPSDFTVTRFGTRADGSSGLFSYRYSHADGSISLKHAGEEVFSQFSASESLTPIWVRSRDNHGRDNPDDSWSGAQSFSIKVLKDGTGLYYLQIRGLSQDASDDNKMFVGGNSTSISGTFDMNGVGTEHTAYIDADFASMWTWEDWLTNTPSTHSRFFTRPNESDAIRVAYSSNDFDTGADGIILAGAGISGDSSSSNKPRNVALFRTSAGDTDTLKALVYDNWFGLDVTTTIKTEAGVTLGKRGIWADAVRVDEGKVLVSYAAETSPGSWEHRVFALFDNAFGNALGVSPELVVSSGNASAYTRIAYWAQGQPLDTGTSVVVLGHDAATSPNNVLTEITIPATVNDAPTIVQTSNVGVADAEGEASLAALDEDWLALSYSVSGILTHQMVTRGTGRVANLRLGQRDDATPRIGHANHPTSKQDNPEQRIAQSNTYY